MYRVRDFEEERSRTLYVRLPHRIRDPKEVQELFNGDAKVKLPRQASRACHVIFPSKEDKIKGLKNIKDKTVDGKRIIALNPRTKPMENRKKMKKLVVPVPKKPQNEITQSLFISNLPSKTTINDLKTAFPGCSKVGMLEVNSKGTRSAFIKMESIQIAGEYIRKERALPTINGNSITIRIDTRGRSKRRRGTKTKKLKVYDEEGKATNNKFENLNTKKNSGSEDDDRNNSECNNDSESVSESDNETGIE